MAEKTRYSDEELQEFKELILEKLDKARKDYDLLKGVISGSDGNMEENGFSVIPQMGVSCHLPNPKK